MKEHSDWEYLLSNPPYALKIKRKNNLILFNYTQIESDPSNEIVKEARGTIVEDKTFNPICYGFKRFYNIDEPYAEKINWNTAVATSKEDGTLFFLYWYNNEWHVKTRSTFDAIEAEMDSCRFSNYRELFDYLITFYPNFSYEKLNKNYVYCLEGCSIFNRIVLQYNKPCLFHLMTRDMNSLEEVDVEVGIPKPQCYVLNNENDYRELVEQMDDTHEGIVVRDDNGKRVKIKTLTYFNLHKMKNNGVMTLERVLDLIMKNDQAEFLSYFPEMTTYFDEVAKKYSDAIKNILEIDVEVTHWKTSRGRYDNRRKDFAEWVKNKSDKNLYFLAYDNKLLDKAKDSSAKDFIRLVRMEEEE